MKTEFPKDHYEDINEYLAHRAQEEFEEEQEWLDEAYGTIGSVITGCEFEQD